MAQYPGSIPYTGYVAPADTTDTYPVTHEEFNYGGYRSVANSTERTAITSGRRKEGMLVKQLDTGTYWTLVGGILDANWTQVILAILPNNTTTGIIKVTNGVITYLATSGSGTRFLREDFSWQATTGGVSGSGTIGKLPKFTGASALGDSLFSDDGTTPKYNGYKIWTENNDGASSGLDADTLRGLVPQTSVTDATADRLMRVGAFGLGGNSVTFTSINVDTISVNLNGYVYDSINTPLGANGFIGHNQINSDYATQVFVIPADTPIIFQRNKTGGVWKSWVTIYHSGNSNLPTVDWNANTLNAVTLNVSGVANIVRPTSTLSFSTTGAWSSFSSQSVNIRGEGKTYVAQITFSSSSSATTWQELGSITGYVSPGYDVYFNVVTIGTTVYTSAGIIGTNGKIVIQPVRPENYIGQATWIVA